MAKFGKILLKERKGVKRAERSEVFLAVQKELKVPLTGLKPTNAGYVAFTERESDIDKLLTKKANEIIKKLGLETNVPPKVRAQRSVICRQLDPHVGARTADEIKTEINSSNSSLTVEQIIKFRDYTHVFKIEFETTDMAERAAMHGILSFNVKISPAQIEREKHYDILICFNCYKLDAHTQAYCDVPRRDVCSECSGNHNYRDCTSEYKKCLNCEGPHRTMAMICPVRKRIIESIKRQRKTYRGRSDRGRK